MAAAAAATAAPLVLVTGASGYIAVHITGILLKAGWRVRGTVRNPDDALKTAPLRSLPGAADRLELVKADLLQPAEDWKPIVAGCDYVLHTASPFPLAAPKHKSELIEPAVQGATSVIQACVSTPSVKRAVLTSSCAAIAYGHKEGMGSKVWTPADWTDADAPGVGAYVESKTRAERAAWDVVKAQPEGRKLEFATINPSLVQGPMLSSASCASLDLVKQIILGEMPGLVDVFMNTVDVRDVAEAHVRAMINAEAPGKRFILGSTELSLGEISRTIKDEFAPLGYTNVTSMQLPSWLVRALAWFSSDAALMAPDLGQRFRVDASETERVLGMRLRDTHASVLETVASGIRGGHIPDKTPDGRFTGSGPRAAMPVVETDVSELTPAHARR
ncbi:hypothetical protein FNF29_01727 [Cafeteria roenbergensis]|uniref:NAD-dependent epimerase/dehydratase domain-containing protein n=1 Tax=Cafeteria roenbergensis TaxID=33653 RepID=A0A5A8CQG7_CAFRO|nr:hypothetical protein FNF29_01727 [Cafeteria roenbergensis]|eukprot:KAA0155352.1 hypothetical protein FNF29_01727 [Cafeteria roenbergensis]